ncbi:MAG: lysozyme inhibitor LprI family protein [Pseudomonadota bacterium]
MTKGSALRLSVSALAMAVTTEVLAGSGAAKHAQDPSLNGVTMLPEAAVSQRYPIGDTLDPTVDAAVRALHRVWLSPNAVCGVRIKDGRQFILIQAETSHADGSIPYVFAFDPGWTTKYLAQGDNAQAGAKAFYGNPDGVMRSVMASAVQGCVNLRADLGLDPNGTDTGVAPMEAPSTPDVPGAPSGAQCAQLPGPAGKTPQTQQALTEEAGNRALRDGCQLRAAYLGLQKRLTKDPGASVRLRETQQTWAAYADAHEREFYSHADEPSYYGSMFSMCLIGVQDSAILERGKQLKTEKACASLDVRASAADENALKAAAVALNTALANVKTVRAKEPLFLTALARGEATWGKYANAQVAFASGRDSGGIQYSCGARERTRISSARAKALAELARPKQDTCDPD